MFDSVLKTPVNVITNIWFKERILTAVLKLLQFAICILTSKSSWTTNFWWNIVQETIIKISEVSRSVNFVKAEWFQIFIAHCTKHEINHPGSFQQMWPNPRVTADSVTFAEEIFNRKLHLLRSSATEISPLSKGLLTGNFREI